MLKFLFPAIAVAGFTCAQPCSAQTSETPGVTEVAPGVRKIDGSKVPSLRLDATGLEATIKERKSFSAAKKLLGGDGISNVGPGGSTVHMYKVHDTISGKNVVVVLFVKGDAIVDYLIT